MQKFLFSALAAAIAVVAVSSADATERFPRWYVGLKGGMNFADDTSFSNGSNYGFDDGGSFSAQLGYRPNGGGNSIMDSTRIEAEYYYSQNQLSRYTAANNTLISTSGDHSVNAGMLNVYFDLFNNENWVPYIGAGLGFAGVDIDWQPTTGAPVSISETTFAYQFMAGLAYTTPAVPNVDWVLGYRYFATSDIDAPAVAAGVDRDFDSHTAEAGIRLKF